MTTLEDQSVHTETEDQSVHTETMESLKSHSSYMNRAFDDSLETMVMQFKNSTEGLDFDTIVGTGLSGALVVPTLARTLGLKWAIVRKPNDGSHAIMEQEKDEEHFIEGEIGHKWLFVDDFVASGTTLRRVKNEVDHFVQLQNHKLQQWSSSYFKYVPFHTEYVGTYEYTFQSLKS